MVLPGASEAAGWAASRSDPICLRACYALSGADIAYAAWSCYALSGTVLEYAATLLLRAARY
eukprot:111549-Rhodomonas_salina.1